MIHRHTFVVRTRERGTVEIGDELARIVAASGIRLGLCNVFLPHTSASLILCENADATVRHDLETAMRRLAPDGDPANAHDTEGPDDMPAHLRSVLTSNSLTIPCADGTARARNLARRIPVGASDLAPRTDGRRDGARRTLGSGPSGRIPDVAPVAQWIEHPPPKGRVARSIRAGGASESLLVTGEDDRHHGRRGAGRPSSGSRP